MKSNTAKPLSTGQIQILLKNSKMDYEDVVNKALNAYLPRIFLVCPFTDEICSQKKQCLGCQNSSVK